MHFIIQPNTMIPIYEQIADQIRGAIKNGVLVSGQVLPSVRSCARECEISALTVKKAYDTLEKEGYVKTVQGKGTFIAQINPQIVQEEMQKQLEASILKVIDKARMMKMSSNELLELVSLLMEEEGKENL